MKAIFQLALPALMLLASPSFAQKKKNEKPASPPATVTQKISSGATLSIDYSQPSVKGRTIGKDLEPMDGQIWRLGANKATTSSTDKALTIEGASLPAGKYALFAIKNGATWTLIFNKVWETWGAYDYDKNKGSDVARVDVQGKTGAVSEQLVFHISPQGLVSFNWGPHEVSFSAKAAN